MIPPKQIIIDCDPGHDDAVAILLAAARTELKILGITTVAGNTSVDKTTRNCLRICQVAKLTDVPVARGMDRPLIRNRIDGESFHGPTGIDGVRLPETTKEPVREHAVNFIIELLMSAREKITVILTGPQTNLAMALRLEPAIAERISEVVFMGGAMGSGNETPTVEFNIHADPEAADIVLNSGIPLTMLGLHVTHKALATEREAAVLGDINTPPAQIVSDVISYLLSARKERIPLAGTPIHDACAVAMVAMPGLFQCEKMYVQVETRGRVTYGETVCDRYGLFGKPPNVTVATDIDAQRFFRFLIDSIGSF